MQTELNGSSTAPDATMLPRRDVVAIGTSAGGSEALSALFAQLPDDIEASFFVVSHVLPGSQGHLVDALNTNGPLIAKHAEDGEEIRRGVVYVAPPDRHLLVKRDYLRVTRGPRENRWRPSIDALFRSAAVAYSNRVLGVVLSGMLDDGTAGLVAIKRCGGIAIVQDPEEAAYPEMPQNALANVAVDHKLGVADIADAIEQLVRERVDTSVQTPHDLELEALVAENGEHSVEVGEETGKLTRLSCLECGGPLWESKTGNTNHYRCRVGHAYGADSLAVASGEVIESTLWAAVRLFEQRANILTTLAEKDRYAQRSRLRERHVELAQEARQHAEHLRTMLIGKREQTS